MSFTSYRYTVKTEHGEMPPVYGLYLKGIYPYITLKQGKLQQSQITWGSEM